MDIVAIRRRAPYPPTKSMTVRRGKTRNAFRFGPIASAGLDRHPVALSERLVRFGVDAHPELRRCAGERAADLCRCAQREHPVRDLGLGRHERARGYHCSGTDAGAIQNRRAVADQALLTQGGRVDRAVVANRRARAHLGSLARRDVHDRAVLHVRAAADDDRAEVGATLGAAAFSAGAGSRGVTSISTPPPSARTRAWTDCKTGSGVARSSSARRRRGARSRGRAGSRVTWISWRRRRAPDGSRPAWTPA